MLSVKEDQFMAFKKTKPQASSALPFEVVSEVTTSHGKAFADHLLRNIKAIATSAAFESGVLLEMPPEGENAISAAEQRYMDLGREIAAEFLRELKPAVSAAFELAATRVLGVGRSAALSATDRSAIRSIFMEPKELYDLSEAAALVGIPTDRFVQFIDLIEFEHLGSKVPLRQVLFVALDVWSKAQIEDALGAGFADIFEPLCSTSYSPSMRLPRYVFEWLTAVETKRLSNLYGRPVTVEAALESAIDQHIDGDEGAPEAIVRAAIADTVAAVLESRVRRPRVSGKSVRIAEAAAEKAADAIDAERLQTRRKRA